MTSDRLHLLAPVEDPDRGPTDAELDAIEQERPAIEAQVELLDVQISLLDRPANDIDTQRLRRAGARLLAARRAAANRAAGVVSA